jgi:electron transfer flavoprotein alpha subunit
VKRILLFAENMPLAAQLISVANSLGAPISAACTEEGAAASLASYSLEEVIQLQGASARPEDYARPLADLARELDAGLLLLADTIPGRELAARVAAYLDAPLVSGARQVRLVQDGLETSRILYGGAAVKKEALHGPAVVTVPPGANPPAAPTPGSSSPIRRIPAAADGRVRVLENRPIERKTAGLGTAKTVVGVGLGFNTQADLALADALAAALHAAVGCTRPIADDKKWLPSELYIGISGENIHPDLYIAVGISGQVQHMAGVRDAKVIVAINKDDHAAIFKTADYAIVGDLYKVLPAFTEAIQRR